MKTGGLFKFALHTSMEFLKLYFHQLWLQNVYRTYVFIFQNFIILRIIFKQFRLAERTLFNHRVDPHLNKYSGILSFTKSKSILFQHIFGWTVYLKVIGGCYSVNICAETGLPTIYFYRKVHVIGYLNTADMFIYSKYL